jgi:hypothetical protein
MNKKSCTLNGVTYVTTRINPLLCGLHSNFSSPAVGTVNERTYFIPKEMSTIRLRRTGNEYCNVSYRTISSVFHLQHECKISACAPLTFPSCTARKWLSHQHVFSSTYCHWISCDRGKLGRSHLSATSWCTWVPAVSEGGWNILRTETRTSPISRAVVNREPLQLRATSKKSTIIRQDRRITFREIAAQLGVGHHAVQEMMEILGYRKVCSRWVPRLLKGTEASCEELEWTSTAYAFLRFLQR